ncbi:MAG: ECF transporter S component [Deltaproteobacteria bacterium]|nr:ECF transporter S component [Deltaproteobacteria bacterium]
MWKINNRSQPDAVLSQKILVCALAIAGYALTNYFLRIHLPGVSNVDLRPQIVLIFVVGYLYGPCYGFLAGFAGNFCTDLLFGYGLRYLPSWTIGNGLIGALIGFFPYRKAASLERIGQMVSLIIMLIFVNTAALAYASGMVSLLDKQLPSAINFRYFYVPALLSNIIGTLVLFPAILLGLQRFKLNYPIKLSLAVYYLTVLMLVLSWIVLNPTYRYIPALFNPSSLSMEQGNALVDAFSYWAFLLVILLVLSFVVSGWMSKAIITPLKRLEDAVLTVLKGDSSSAQKLDGLARRSDEVGILSYTVQLLSEEFWETQKLSRRELEKTLKFIDERDTGTDVLVVALASLFGKDNPGAPEAKSILDASSELTNVTAIALVVSACGLQELAATYSDAKIDKSFQGMDVNVTQAALTRDHRQALALSIDVHLLFKGRLKVMDLHAPLNRDMAFHLLERVHAFRLSRKKYAGYVTEPGIVGKLLDQWEKSAGIGNENVIKRMNLAVANGTIIGYHIKRLENLANFDVDLKISYSHNDIKHIKQLVGLLIGENMQAKLQMEPKCSSFLLMDGWEMKEAMHLETLPDGRKAAHMTEFDLVMEFTLPEDRDRFRQIIEQYAKREDKEGGRILFESFYHPLYKSDVPLEGFNRIADIILRNKTHIVQTFVKEEGAAAKLEWFKREMPDMDITVTPVWVNDDFFRYLNEVQNR